MNTVLVIEDERAILGGLRDNLEFEGYRVLTASDGESGLKLAAKEHPDAIILDLMLPRLSGYEVCRRLRAEKIATPILMLTARGEEMDRVLGLDLGADDYMTKPFSVRELAARLRALLRRTRPEQGAPREIRFGSVHIDFERYEASNNGLTVDLTRKEFAVMRMLAAKPGVAVTRDELLEQIWGYDARQSTRTVDNHIAALRAKLEPEDAPRYLITIHGIGYKLALEEPGK